MTKSILFVDDEEHILKSLRRLLMQTDYETFFALSGKEALFILENEKIDLIITDMRMPEMDGYQLLKQVRNLYPGTMRVILSGYADEKEIINALQDGSTRIYLMKPWSNENLLMVIKQLLELRDMFKNKKVLEIMNDLDGLPTLPTIYTKVCRLIEENVNIECIAEVIEEDQIITAKILQIANSIFYGKQTGSVKQAIVFLGLANVKNIVLSISLIEKSGIQCNAFPAKEMLWRHVSLTNKLVYMIYEELLHKKLPSISATAGLLHDIGKAILMQNFPKQYQRVSEQIKSDSHDTVCEMESQILSVSHQEIGGFLLNWWGMPQSIVEAAAFHHMPFDKRVIEKELVCVVHLADYYSWEKMGKGALAMLDTDVFPFLGINQQECEQLIENLKVDY